MRARAGIIFGDKYPQFDRLSKSFVSASIDRRYSVVPIDWFHEPHVWVDRNTVFMTDVKAMFLDAAGAALRDVGWRADQVDCVVTVSSTGIATPTLKAQVFFDMGFRDYIMRVPLFGLGCAGGVSGLSIARTLTNGQSGAKVLLVVIETCSLSFRADRLQKADIIATALFGDGTAAACLSSETQNNGPLVELGQGHQKIWLDTLGIMGWDVDEAGFGVVFNRSIPTFVSEEFAVATQGALDSASLSHTKIDRYMFHPGGAKVVEAIEDALHLE
ncbi:naringenin-chalcone synthase, putative [Rhodobacteraceae bacterium HTCC2083]|nr:naringenin-chalcone synthase, putative [Rhodobacteraceae bacterium HTCC2083]